AVARLVELADTAGLGPAAARRGGSSPSPGTIFQISREFASLTAPMGGLTGRRAVALANPTGSSLHRRDTPLSSPHAVAACGRFAAERAPEDRRRAVALANPAGSIARRSGA